MAAESPPLAIVVAGSSTATGVGLGLGWLGPGFQLAFVAGVVDAWGLLVEILR